eukprot:g1817.t1
MNSTGTSASTMDELSFAKAFEEHLAGCRILRRRDYVCEPQLVKGAATSLRTPTASVASTERVPDRVINLALESSAGLAVATAVESAAERMWSMVEDEVMRAMTSNARNDTSQQQRAIRCFAKQTCIDARARHAQLLRSYNLEVIEDLVAACVGRADKACGTGGTGETGEAGEANEADDAGEASNLDDTDDADYADCMFSLFLDEDYREMTYSFPSYGNSLEVVEQPCLALRAASTEYDRTGQIVWPVSVFLSWFVLSEYARPALQGRVVVEVGSGIVLGGLCAAHRASTTALTDGSDIVMRLLECTAAFCSERQPTTHSKPQLMVHKLLWGDQASFSAFTRAFAGGAAVDAVIGADVLCWPESVRPLLTTVRALLLRSQVTNPPPAFYCGFVCRANSMRRVLEQEVASLGFALTSIPSQSFLFSPLSENVRSDRELEMLKLVLEDTGTDMEWINDDGVWSGSAC